MQRRSKGEGDHARPQTGRRREAGQVSRRPEGGHARRRQAGGREAAAVNYLPHVVAWNLTRRCNLECAHCYISAGPHESATSELDTAECLRIIDELLAVNPAPMVILSCVETLLRRDLTLIVCSAVL